MPEALQTLIDKIQHEAVEEARQQAEAIIADAHAKARASEAEAEAKARAILAAAERDAQAFTERSQQALKQAGRDLLIAVSQGVEAILAGLVQESVEEALTPELVKGMLVKMAEAYTARGGQERRMAVLLSTEDHEALVSYYADLFRQRLIQGVELRLDNDLVRGFRVSMNDGHVYHDFTSDAIAEALTGYLRPHLARLLPRHLPEQAETAGAAAPG